MNTTFETRSLSPPLASGKHPSSRLAVRSCSAIWAADRFLINGIVPVKQNLQLKEQPACDDTQRVPRLRDVSDPSTGMNTVSAVNPSPTSISHFTVPSLESCLVTTLPVETWNPCSWRSALLSCDTDKSSRLCAPWRCTSTATFSASCDDSPSWANTSRSRPFGVPTRSLPTEAVPHVGALRATRVRWRRREVARSGSVDERCLRGVAPASHVAAGL